MVDMRVMSVRPAHPESYEFLCHASGLPGFLLPLRDPVREDVRSELRTPRLERAIGVVYRPETELQSHYFHAALPFQFVARNRLVEYQLDENWPDTGRDKDEAEFAGLEWIWQSEVKPTPDNDVRRIDIEVWMEGADIDEEQPLATLSGFMGKRQ